MIVPLWLRIPFKLSWRLLPLKYTLFIALCFWGLYAQQEYRISGYFLPVILPWIGLTLGLLNFVLLLDYFVLQALADTNLRYWTKRIEYSADIFILLFVYCSLLIYLNGRLGTNPVEQKSEILSISEIKVNWGRRFSLSWADLKPRDAEATAIHILLKRSEEDKLWGGERVIVHKRSGYLGIPCVVKIEPDEQYYVEEVLKLAPTSTMIWRNRINFLLQHRQWEEAYDATQQQLLAYPHDYRYFASVGGLLNAAGQIDKGNALLEYVVAHRPTYRTYQALGWGLYKAGNSERSIEVLKKSIPLAPDDWEVYFHLAESYVSLGQYAQAIASYEELLKRRPHFPEMQDALANLRKLEASSNKGGS